MHACIYVRSWESRKCGTLVDACVFACVCVCVLPIHTNICIYMHTCLLIYMIGSLPLYDWLSSSPFTSRLSSPATTFLLPPFTLLFPRCRGCVPTLSLSISHVHALFSSHSFYMIVYEYTRMHIQIHFTWSRRSHVPALCAMTYPYVWPDSCIHGEQKKSNWDAPPDAALAAIEPTANNPQVCSLSIFIFNYISPSELILTSGRAAASPSPFLSLRPPPPQSLSRSPAPMYRICQVGQACRSAACRRQVCGNPTVWVPTKMADT